MVYSMSMTGQRPAYAGLLFSGPTAKARPKSDPGAALNRPSRRLR